MRALRHAPDLDQHRRPAGHRAHAAVGESPAAGRDRQATPGQRRVAIRAKTGRVVLPDLLVAPPDARLCVSQRRARDRPGHRAALHAERAGRPHGDRRNHEAGAVAAERGVAPGRHLAPGRVRADPRALARSRRRVVGRAGLSVDMGPVALSRTRSIFSPATDRERAENFESYWIYVQRKNGEILEDAKDLTEKQRALVRFQERAVRSRKPLSESFDRNYDTMRDDPQSLDRRTLLLTFLYKFARHEWVGISAAWDVTPTMAQGVRLIDKISRYHLAEEFCHMRLFHEMFQTFRLEGVEWGPLPKRTKQLYGAFSRLPGALVAPPAFVSELMGLTVYLHTDKMLDEILADEPEVRDRARAIFARATSLWRISVASPFERKVVWSTSDRVARSACLTCPDRAHDRSDIFVAPPATTLHVRSV